MKTENKNVVRLTESQLKSMVAESVREALNEGIMGGAMRRAYNGARYDNDKFSLKGAGKAIGNYIKGDTDYDDSKEWYDYHKNAYKDAKKSFSNDNFDGAKPQGGYKNWTPKAMAQDMDVDYHATDALEAKPGLGGKITRAASVPLIAGANLAGRIARRFGGKQVSESQMYEELIEMINETKLNSKIDRIVSESIDRILKNK